MSIMVYSESTKGGGVYILEIDNVAIKGISIGRLQKLRREINKCIGEVDIKGRGESND